jgi:hypothetical protein
MSNPYSSFCEDFYVNLRLGSQLNLPHQRETLLHFLRANPKRIPLHDPLPQNRRAANSISRKTAPAKTTAGSASNRAASSAATSIPPASSKPCKLHTLLLQLAPFHLGVSPVEIDYLDILFGFDLTFSGNHDEIIAESLLADSPLNCLTEEPGAKPVDFQPSVTVALTDDCRLQARIDIVTRTNSYQVRTGDYSDDVISVCLILRRYWGDRPRIAMEKLLRRNGRARRATVRPPHPAENRPPHLHAPSRRGPEGIKAAHG